MHEAVAHYLGNDHPLVVLVSPCEIIPGGSYTLTVGAPRGVELNKGVGILDGITEGGLGQHLEASNLLLHTSMSQCRHS